MTGTVEGYLARHSFAMLAFFDHGGTGGHCAGGAKGIVGHSAGGFPPRTDSTCQDTGAHTGTGRNCAVYEVLPYPRMGNAILRGPHPGPWIPYRSYKLFCGRPDNKMRKGRTLNMVTISHIYTLFKFVQTLGTV